LLRLATLVVSRVVVRPVRWTINRAKLWLHAFLVWRKGEPDHAP
jgi:hypothetical protein